MWYLIHRKPIRPREKWTVGLDQHLVWMKQQHEDGRVLFSGPTSDRKLGIYVIRAGSRGFAPIGDGVKWEVSGSLEIASSLGDNAHEPLRQPAASPW